MPFFNSTQTDLLIQTALVISAGILLWKISFINKKKQQRNTWSENPHSTHLLLLKVNAYERFMLFIERIHPNNLLLRIDKSNLTAISFGLLLFKTIRAEYDQNLAQQIYLSDSEEQIIRQVKDETLLLINMSLSEINEQEPAMTLSRKILEKHNNSQTDRYKEARMVLRKSMSKL